MWQSGEDFAAISFQRSLANWWSNTKFSGGTYKIKSYF